VSGFGRLSYRLTGRNDLPRTSVRSPRPASSVCCSDRVRSMAMYPDVTEPSPAETPPAPGRLEDLYVRNGSWGLPPIDG